MTEPMGLREFGRWIDLSGEGVRKAIKTGRIPPALIGERSLSTGRKRPVILDPAAAAAALGANTDSRQQRDTKVLAENRRRVAHGEPKLPPAQIAAGDVDTLPPADMPPARAGGQVGKSSVPTQAESNAITAAYKAREAKLDYEERLGKLVKADEIEKTMVTMIRDAATKLRGVPTSAKMAMPHLTVRDVEQLENMIDEALEALANYGS